MNIKKTLWYQGVRDTVHAYRDLTSGFLKYARLGLARKLISVPTREITDEFAFSLAPEGWNYYCALVAEYQKRPDINLEETTYYKFFQHELVNAVRNLDDVLYLHDSEKRTQPGRFKFFLGTYPWGGLTQADSLVGGTPFGWYYDSITGKMTRDLWGYKQTLWYKPNERYTLGFEWNYTLQNYFTLKTGYRPVLYGSFPCATLLIRRNGEMRAVMGDGHHRLAVLSCLGYKQIIVHVVHTIKEAEVDQWYYVKRGQCSREQAIGVFNTFFELNGRERLIHLGIDSSMSGSVRD
jgi:hypothetical protein